MLLAPVERRVDVRSLIGSVLLTGLALGVGGCDRRSAEAEQAGAAANSASAPAADEVPSSGADTTSFKPVIDRSKKGQALPAISVAGPDGKPLALASLKGKPVLLNLWATWCGPCVKELPALDRLAARAPGGLNVIAVSQDAAEVKIGDFLTRNKVGVFANHRDPESALAFHYGGGTLPLTVLYDAQGKEVLRVVGALEWDQAEGAELLKEAGA
jgi:thiol-disulfide isomerase/thioredoxin